MAQSRTKRKPFHVSILEKIVRTSPTNKFVLAGHDLRVTVPSVKRSWTRSYDKAMSNESRSLDTPLIWRSRRKVGNASRTRAWLVRKRQAETFGSKRAESPVTHAIALARVAFLPARRLNNGREIRRVDGQVAAPAAAPPRAGSPVAPRSTAPGPRKRS